MIGYNMIGEAMLCYDKKGTRKNISYLPAGANRKHSITHKIRGMINRPPGDI